MIIYWILIGFNKILNSFIKEFCGFDKFLHDFLDFKQDCYARSNYTVSSE